MGAGIDWTTKAEEYRRAIAKSLSDTVLPDLESHVASSRMLTPLDFRDRLSSINGAAFGLQPILTADRLVPPAQPQLEDIGHLYLVARGARIRVRGCRA